MGTRGMTAVMVDGKYVVAQYGQWDHYPSGQGTTALDFCRKHLKTKKGRAEFKEKLAHVQFSKDEEQLKASTYEREREDFANVSAALDSKDGSKIEMVTKREQYPYCGRDNGAEILNLIWDDASPEKPIYLFDEIDFVGDSLFCEYAYVIDLDAETFEIFKGFNKRPLGEKQRFKDYVQKAEHRKEDDQYQPVRLLKKYDLDNLPSKSVFLEELEPKEEE